MSYFWPHRYRLLLLVLASFAIMPLAVRAQDSFKRAESLIDGHNFPLLSDPSEFEERIDSSTLKIQAASATQFVDEGKTSFLLRGNCQIQLGPRSWSAPNIVLWKVSSDTDKVLRYVAYLESTSEEPVLQTAQNYREQKPYLVINLKTSGGEQWLGTTPVQLDVPKTHALVIRARERAASANPVIESVQYAYESEIFGSPSFDVSQGFGAPINSKIPQNVTISPRILGGSLDIKGEVSEGSIPPEYVMTVNGGVNIVVDNVPMNVGGVEVLSRVDLTADQAVIWTDANQVRESRSFQIDPNTPLQIYLEGNIVVRQGGNHIRATHAYYDINQRRGMALNAELRTYLEEMDTTLRLRAAEVRQINDNRFQARDAFLTTSEFGKPKYRIQASEFILEEVFGPESYTDPMTGQVKGGKMIATGYDNTLFLGDTPVFSTPYLSSPAEDPQIPLRRLEVGFSRMYGPSFETAWDLDTILGLNLQDGADLQLQADYFGRRGPGGGLRTKFNVESDFFGMPVEQTGWGQAYYIYDHGEDNLGLGRRNLTPISKNRGRIVFQDRIRFSDELWMQAEVGHILSKDRNFDEQFNESQFDNNKDLENRLLLTNQVDNLTMSLEGAIRSNDFNNSTNWFPKADLTLLGQQVFNSPVIWNTHSSVGYGQLRSAVAPPDPTVDPWDPLPYFDNVEGVVAMTRHELNMPFNVGPVNFVPYMMGELAHWDEDLTGSSMDRAYGSLGIKSNIQFSKYMPYVQSDILGLNGLAHKINFDAEYYYAQSSQSLSSVAQYNAFDDNSQERFRERLRAIEFGGGTIPAYMDPRQYAVRSGSGRAITASAYELVDDQHTLWLGMRNRWQTKAGPYEDARVVDWMEFDLGTALFPNANEDNFGETLGLINSRYAWHVSPRTSFVASGVWDVFKGGQNVWNAGVLHQRSARGSMYVGYRQVDVGPINSQLITSSFSYVLSPDLYVVTAAAQFDIAEGRDRGESLTITRIGENFLLHFGMAYDRSRDNVGLAISVEPKFGSYGSSSMQLNNLLGIR